MGAAEQTGSQQRLFYLSAVFRAEKSVFNVRGLSWAELEPAIVNTRKAHETNSVQPDSAL